MQGSNRKQRFAFGQKPASISDTPRDSEHGTVVDEVGVFQDGSGSKNYWKVIQRLEADDGRSEVRYGYYVGQGGDWSWAGNPLILDSDIENELEARAVSQGIKSL